MANDKHAEGNPHHPLHNAAEGCYLLLDNSVLSPAPCSLLHQNHKLFDATPTHAFHGNLSTFDHIRPVKSQVKSTKNVSGTCKNKNVQLLGLSLESYADVLFCMDQGQHHLGSFTKSKLTKVLHANNLSSCKTATKEYITTHIREVPLFKPSFSSVERLNSSMVTVSGLGLDDQELVQDLNALGWLEDGYALVQPQLERSVILPCSRKQQMQAFACRPIVAAAGEPPIPPSFKSQYHSAEKHSGEPNETYLEPDSASASEIPVSSLCNKQVAERMVHAPELLKLANESSLAVILANPLDNSSVNGKGHQTSYETSSIPLSLSSTQAKEAFIPSADKINLWNRSCLPQFDREEGCQSASLQDIVGHDQQQQELVSTERSISSSQDVQWKFVASSNRNEGEAAIFFSPQQAGDTAAHGITQPVCSQEAGSVGTRVSEEERATCDFTTGVELPNHNSNGGGNVQVTANKAAPVVVQGAFMNDIAGKEREDMSNSALHLAGYNNLAEIIIDPNLDSSNYEEASIGSTTISAPEAVSSLEDAYLKSATMGFLDVGFSSKPEMHHSGGNDESLKLLEQWENRPTKRLHVQHEDDRHRDK